MQADQQQKLAQLINTSQVLQNDERQAWLAMLPVMNDKQAGDLFGILTSPITNKTIQSGSTSQNDKQPSLRHIANLPTEMSYHMGSNDRPSQQSVSQPVAVKQKSMARPTQAPQPPRPQAPQSQRQPQPSRPSGAPHPDMAQVIKQRLEEKELPASHDTEPLELMSGHAPAQSAQTAQTAKSKPALVEDSEVQLMRKKISNPRSASLATMPKPQQQTNEYIPLDELLKDRKNREGAREAIRVAAKPKPVVTNPSANPAQEINNIDSITSCSLETLQNQGFQALNDQLIKLVREHGYFPVILRFEASPLYNQYLEAGKAWLSANSGEKSPVTFPKTEFEKVTDILRNMQLA